MENTGQISTVKAKIWLTSRTFLYALRKLIVEKDGDRKNSPRIHNGLDLYFQTI